MALQLSERGRRKRRSGGWVRGSGGGVKRECAPLGRHGNRTVDHVISHAQPRHQTTMHRLCAKVFWTPSRHRRNMPSHAAFARADAGTARFARRHACRYALLRHALSESPPTPSTVPIFERHHSLRHPGHATERTRGPNSSRGKKESQHSLCTKFISCKDFNIYMFSLSIFFSLHKCKIHAFTFPQVQPHPILCRIALFFFFSFLNCMIQ